MMTDFQTLLAIFATPGLVALDFETTIARPHEREVCTVQAAHEDGREAVVYCYNQPHVIAHLMRAIRESPARIAAHFAIFEAEVLTKYGGMPKDLVCTFVAGRVLRGIIPGNGIDPDFSLKGLVKSELGETMPKETRARDWREPLDAEAIEYCLNDVRYARDIWILYDYEFDHDPDQYRGFQIVNDAIPAIAACNLNGLVFDEEAHRKLCISHEAQAEALLFEMDLACEGGIVNHNSAKQVSQWCANEICFEETSTTRASLLFQQMTGTSWKVTANKQLSLGKDYLATLLGVIEENWPNVGAYLRLRLRYQKHAKLLQAFGEPLATKIDADGHLRGSLIPHGARTSRQSCRDPNLQQMPAEDEFRAMFKALKGRVIVQCDYSQIELRVGCIIGDDEYMQEVFRLGLDIHTATACSIHGLAISEYDGSNPEHVKWRKDGKPVTFAALYGAMATTIALNSGLSMRDAEELLNNWLDVYRGIRAYREAQPDKAKEDGYVQLVSGQKIAVTKTSRPPQLINAPVQGSAASVMYRALTRVHAALQASGLDAKLALNVHDEILLDCSVEDSIAAAELLQTEMTAAMADLYPEARDMGLDRVADAVIIPNWGVKDDNIYSLAEWKKRGGQPPEKLAA